MHTVPRQGSVRITAPLHRAVGFPCARRSGFTLIELLVVIAVIIVVVSLVVYVGSMVRGSGRSVKELAIARQLMTGYLAYSADHRGALMPGYYAAQPPLPVPVDESGTPITGEGAYRYAWRLAPYVDFQLEALIQDPWLLEDLRYTNQFDYFVSLYPTMGLNTTFLGGDSSPEGLGFNPAYQQLFGNFYLSRLSQARRPADLIVFGSARTNAPYEPGSPPIIEGYFKIGAPNLFNRRWAAEWNVDGLPIEWGHLSMRLPGTRAAFGFLDGHTGLLDDGEVQDMRRWCDRADKFDWVLAPD